MRRRAGHGAVVSRELLQAGSYAVEVTRKRIVRAYLRVFAPDGPVQVSAPASMSSDEIARFVLAHAAWIDQRRAALVTRPARGGAHASHVEADGTVTLWGERRTLDELQQRANDARRRAGKRASRAQDLAAAQPEARERAVKRALGELLLDAGSACIAAWEPRMGVRSAGLRVRDAHSRWGSCDTNTHVIMLSLMLTHYPPEMLELTCVHELCHLIERGHGPAFHALMDRYLPDWREREQRRKTFEAPRS